MTERTPEEADRLEGAPHPRETPRLFGQEAAEAAYLDAAGAGRLHHGWLITGSRGVGKATLAWRIARHLVAGGAGDTLDMDPDAPDFRKVAALAHPQVALVRIPWDDKAGKLKSAIGVDEVRGLRGFFQLTAADGGRRVAIVDTADDLTDQAANALLKILEEPPRGAVLLLVSHRPSRLLPTVRSRCRELRLQTLAPGSLAEALRQAGAPEAEASEPRLAELAGGSVGGALRLIAGGGVGIYDEITALVGTAPSLDRRRAVAVAEACAGRAAADRYDLTLEMIRLALGRLALAGAGAAVAPSGAAEAATMGRLAATPGQSRVWADAVSEIVARTDHARAVHLDPALVILDTFRRIDAAAGEALARAV